MNQELTAYCKTYNHRIPQRSLDHRSPVQALQAWQVSKPHLFKRAVYKQAGLDIKLPQQAVFWVSTNVVAVVTPL
jgi:hypothetical protein